MLRLRSMEINVWLYKYCHFEKALLRAPKMQEFNRVLCQIALGHPKIYENYDADISICETILRIRTMSAISQYV